MVKIRNERPLLAILDRDEKYAAKLAEYMNDMRKKRSFPFETCAFTDLSRFLDYAGSRQIAVLLLDETFSDEAEAARLADTVKLCLWLEGSGTKPGTKRDGNVPVIARYQSADHLIEELLGACAGERLLLEQDVIPAAPELLPGDGSFGLLGGEAGRPSGAGAGSGPAGRQGIGSGTAHAGRQGKGPGNISAVQQRGIRKGMPSADAAQSGDNIRDSFSAYYGEHFRSLPASCEVIGIFSPVGRCGKTGFALALGEILAEERKTIYLNLERYSGLKDLAIIPDGGGDINDLIYFYRLDENSLVYRLSSLIRSFRNLDYIAPALTGEDVMSVNASEWSSIISTLAAAGEYEVVILDLGVSLEDAVYLLSICDRVYMPVLDDRVSSAKTAQFFEAAGRSGAAGLQDKVKMLHLPVVREEVWGTDAPARLARGKMGAYVRRVLNER